VEEARASFHPAGRENMEEEALSHALRSAHDSLQAFLERQ